MMLGGKQDQKAGSQAVAIQAGGDVHYHGVSVTEVKELCAMYLRENFPALKAEAQAAAEANVRRFALMLTEEFSVKAESIVLEKFKDPDVQAALNDAVAASARRGDKASPEVLCKLIVHRMEADTSDFLETVLGQAIITVPGLNKPQLGFIALLHLLRYVGLSKPDFSAFEKVGCAALQIVESGFALSGAQQKNLQYAGITSISPGFGSDVYNAVFARYKAQLIEFSTVEEMCDAMKALAPTYMKILDEANSMNILTYDLTSVGQAVGLTVLEKSLTPIFGKIQFTSWLS